MTWQLLAGQFEWWADEALRNLGRRRYYAARGRVVAEEERGPALAMEVRPVAFVAQRSPWRLARIALQPQPDEAAIVAWADDATAVLAGSPATLRVLGPNETWGDLGLRRMLDPERLEALVPQPWSATFRVDGALVDGDLSVVPELVSLSADHYEAAYDAALGVLTRWTAVIDGEVAARHELRDLALLATGSDGAPAR